MSEPMNMKDLSNLLDHIRLDHSFCKNRNGKSIKYIDPHIDTRNWVCFAITFRGLGGEKTFHTQNECRDLKESLFDRCMTWLDEEAN